MIIDKITPAALDFSLGCFILFVTASVMIDSGYLRFLDSIFIGQIQKILVDSKTQSCTWPPL
ncbi:hypothetical protein AKUH3B102A_11750 [Apilactobacillus kunkeei]|nr:hypothetical protein AKUH3B102A_11750 [Apilactobacillus kunkeei]